MPAAPAGLPPGSVIGILGGGQLGRMIAVAAARLGYRCHVYCPEKDAPAAEVAARATCAGYGDEAALAAFARAVDVVTLEFENVPAATVGRIAETTPVRPDVRALAVAQDRVAEKTFLNRIGVATTRFAPVESADDLRRAMSDIDAPAILKTARLGYDGKGQQAIRPARPGGRWRHRRRPRDLEERVDFERDGLGWSRAWPDGGPRSRCRERARERDSQNLARSGADRPGGRQGGAVRRAVHRGRARLCRGSRGRVLRRPGRRPSGQRDRPQGAQLGPLDRRRLRRQPVRAGGARGLRPPLADPARHKRREMTNILGAEVETGKKSPPSPAPAPSLRQDPKRGPRKMGHVTRLAPRGSQSMTVSD